jgi:pimeloyl-ACP methyl ester carboxylesterase
LRRPSRRALTLALAAVGAGQAAPSFAARVQKKAPPPPPTAIPPPPKPGVPDVRVARLDPQTELYYVTEAIGAPVIFVHGSLSDFSYWQDQLGPFAERYRVFALSRRYSWPNQNPPRKGYSAVMDAADLAGFIEGLDLAPAHVVGHSYGAFAALFLAARHPALVRTLTLAEPPAMSLLAHVPSAGASQGMAMLKDVQLHLVAPMRAAYKKGDREGAVRTFIDYVRGPGTWAAFSDADKAATMKDAHEWDVIFAGGELFPEIRPAEVASIAAPTLILSGGKSYPFLGLIDQALVALLPRARHIVFPDATHQMWLQEPVRCRQAVFDLIEGKA